MNYSLGSDGPVNTIVFPVVRTDLIIPALESFWRFNAGDLHRVVVVDQSTSGLDDLVSSNLAHVHLRVYRNLGFAKAANVGFRLADTRYVTICNDDVAWFDARWWAGIEAVFTRVKDAVGVNPSCPKITFGLTGASREKPLYIGGFDSRQACLVAGAFDRLVEETPLKGLVNGVAMWCTTFDRERLSSQVGLFDERFYPGGGEDYDLLARCAKSGLHVYGTSESWLWHDWGASKDDKNHDGMARIAGQPSWNKIDELWPAGFDAWGRCGERVPGIYVDPL